MASLLNRAAGRLAPASSPILSEPKTPRSPLAARTALDAPEQTFLVRSHYH
jgi:hypothetical protein